MIKLKMTDWTIAKDITPPIRLGYSGENNAVVIKIEIDKDEVFDFADTKYYLDIMDVVDGEKVVSRTQEMEVVQETLEDESVKYTLQMRPTACWLGKHNLKYLQIRCEYTDDTDAENPTQVVIKSNTFKGIVKYGLRNNPCD